LAFSPRETDELAKKMNETFDHFILFEISEMLFLQKDFGVWLA